MKKLAVPLIAAALVLAACGGGDAEPDTPEQATARAMAEATMDAAIANAEALGVTDQTREYARQWCGPMRSLFEDYSDIESELQDAELSQDFDVFLELMAVLVGPLEGFKNDLEDMDPPDDYADFHDAFVEEITFAVESIKLIEDGGLFGALALGDEPPTAVQPPELEPALIIECGDEFVDILESDVFNDFIGGGGSDPVEFQFGPTEKPCAGAGCSRSDPASFGSSVETSDGQTIRVLDVNLDAEDQVLAENDFIDPAAPGNRMLLIEVEVTYDGAGDETLFVSSGQFSLTGSNNVVYDTFDEGVSCGFLENDLNAELFSGGTARGQLCFQYPETETDLILIVEPTFSFGSESRRYLALD